MTAPRGNTWTTAEAQPADLPSMDGLVGLFQLDNKPDNLTPAKTLVHESTVESVFDPDLRTLVDPTLYQDGGIYRSIVKLQMRYERQTGSQEGWYMGTGWLITPDIMVTAGHNVYNWSGGEDEGGLGKAVTIKCHIGYYGKDSVGKDPSVQSRMARRIVTSAEWLQSKNNRHRDFSFIQVDRPFTGNLRLFQYEATPMSNEEMIGVVGYPGDKSVTDQAGREERGARMYKQFMATAYDRKKAKLELLTYQISTFGGQSGAPVIREGKQVGIATHVYGFGDKNQASPIVDYANFVDAFTKDFPRVGVAIDGVDIYKPQATIDGHESSPETESFWEIIKSVGSVVSTVGQAVVPVVAGAFLGPAGAPISAIAGTALGVLGKVCSESALDGSESTPEQLDSKTNDIVKRGESQRAVVAEATLQAIEKLHQARPDHPGLKMIYDHMSRGYESLRPSVNLLTPHFKNHLIRSAAVIGCCTNYVEKSRAPRLTEGLAQPIQKTSQGTESAYGAGNAFSDALMAPTRSLTGEEAFFEDIGSFFKAALDYSKPTIRETAAAGLKAIAKRLEASGGTESAAEADSSTEETAAAALVLKRAALAECALQAVSTLNAEQLADLKIGGEDDPHQESFIEFVKGAAQAIGGVVMKAAPVIVKHVIPAVIKAATAGQESVRDIPSYGPNDPTIWGVYRKTFAKGPNAGGQDESSTWGRLQQPTPTPSLDRKPSRYFIDSGNALTNTNSPVGLAVGAILSDFAVPSESQFVGPRPNNSPEQDEDLNEDLPVYQIYD